MSAVIHADVHERGMIPDLIADGKQEQELNLKKNDPISKGHLEYP